MINDILRIIQPDDWHLHLRDDLTLKSVLLHTIAQFKRAIIMPNLNPPITTIERANAYRNRILKALPLGSTFEPLMILYLTDSTSPEEIYRAKDSGFIYGVKLYPVGATTNSYGGVSDLHNCYKSLEVLQKVGMPLLIHGEVIDPKIDIFDREAVFIELIMQPLRYDMPELKIVFEHISTKDAVDYVTEEKGSIAATITAHHLLYNRNRIFSGGICPHYYCLPLLKREQDRQALIAAATSITNKKFFLGTDSAPHSKHAKENACGCAGCYTALHALELYTQVFDTAGALETFEAFASINGPNFYGLQQNHNIITLRREMWRIPRELFIGNTTLIPLNNGEIMNWKLV